MLIKCYVCTLFYISKRKNLVIKQNLDAVAINRTYVVAINYELQHNLHVSYKCFLRL